ncbi:MAG: HEPN domain-containing protein [Acidobacteriota bacterium]
MSLAGNRYEAEPWLSTAEEDLAAVRVLIESRAFAQACFYAQQSAEKAVKALWYAVDADPWGHSVQRLVMEFPRRSEVADSQCWIEWGALLDKYYIPARYPNGLPDLTPGQVYSGEDARRGLEAVTGLLAGCRRWLESH